MAAAMGQALVMDNDLKANRIRELETVIERMQDTISKDRVVMATSNDKSEYYELSYWKHMCNFNDSKFVLLNDDCSFQDTDPEFARKTRKQRIVHSISLRSADSNDCKTTSSRNHDGLAQTRDQSP